VKIQKINWKLFIDDLGTLKPDDFFRVFNTWIPNSPEVFVDVADYHHVHDGPLVILVGHYVNYSLDTTGDRLGLLYSRNRELNSTNEEKIAQSLEEILKAGRRLKEDALISNQLKFNQQDLLFIINDRAIAPNTDETFNEIKPALEGVLTKRFNTNSFSLEHLKDPRQRFAVNIRFKEPVLSVL
jgi:hypothetical protein